MQPVLKVLQTGPCFTYQGARRTGQIRNGIGPSGPLDAPSATRANALLLNPLTATVIELALGGVALEVLADTWIAHTGGLDCANLPPSSARLARRGEIFRFLPGTGVWSYIAIPSGFLARQDFGSTSRHTRADLGDPIPAGSILNASPAPDLFPPNIVRRLNPPDRPKSIRVFPAPHTSHFSRPDTLFASPYAVSQKIDRTGYQLVGGNLQTSLSIKSLPLVPGCIQVPPSGQPLVTLNDGPTVGGYPLIGIVHPDDLPTLTQTSPGQSFTFRPTSHSS